MLGAEICHCHCHEEGSNLKHIMACCVRCSHCNQRIKNMSFAEHEKKCSDQLKINGVHIVEILNAFKVLEDAGIDITVLSDQVDKILASVFDKK